MDLHELDLKIDGRGEVRMLFPEPAEFKDLARFRTLR